MDVIGAIHKRKSVRAFKAQPVSRDVLEKILEAAVAAPSKGNSQIWEFVVVTGRKLKEMKEMLHELLKTDFIPSMNLSDEESSNPALKKAQKKSDQNREEIMRILKPMELDFDTFMLEGTFTFFDAPVAILVFIENIFMKNLPHLLSAGASVQNVLLSAQTFGLGTCWIGGIWRYTPRIRKLLGIQETKMLVSSVAIGYPDAASPINEYKSSRDEVGSFVQWVGFNTNSSDT
jgi:nitroreductase